MVRKILVLIFTAAMLSAYVVPASTAMADVQEVQDHSNEDAYTVNKVRMEPLTIVQESPQGNAEDVENPQGEGQR